MSKPTGYTRLQIRLHWIIAALIGVQFLFHEKISDAWELLETGATADMSLAVFSHVAAGVLILLLAIWRIVVKIKRGSPELPAQEPKIQKIAAHATHGIFYLLLILMPLSGLAAWFGGVSAAAETHNIFKVALLVLFVLHFLAALYHRFILKSGVMERMLKAE